jgi:hypothetical protein
MVKPIVPAHQRAHSVWKGPRVSIVYVTEHRRRRLGMHVGLLGAVMTIVLAASDAPPALLLAAIASVAGGGLYAHGATAGFYLLRRDGRLGNFLGKRRPNLGPMRRVKLP